MFQIGHEYERFCKYISNVKIASFFGGLPTKNDEHVIKNNCPHIVVGTPGRILALAKTEAINLHYVKHLIIDACDQALETVGKKKNILTDYQFFYN